MFVAMDKEVSEMEVLVGQDYIGVDSEWRPKLTRWHKTHGIAILQIAGENEVFIVDMIALRQSKALDQMLTRIFSNEHSVIIGCGFTADLKEFKNELGHMKFYLNIPNFLEI